MVLPQSEQIVWVATEARGLVQVNALPVWDYTHKWEKKAGIMNEVTDRSTSICIITAASTCLHFIKHQRITTVNNLPTFIIHNRTEQPYSYIIKISLGELGNAIHCTIAVDKL